MLFDFEEHHEQAFVLDRIGRRRHRLDTIGDYPVGLSVSPCGRYFHSTDKMGCGGVFDATGEPQYTADHGGGEEVPVLLGRTDETDTDDEHDEDSDGPFLALALDTQADVWRTVHAGGLWEGLTQRFLFAGTPSAATFDSAAKRLLLCIEDRLVELSIDGEVLGEWDLGPLRELVTLRALDDERAHRLLCAYGTTAHLPPDLAAFDTSQDWDDEPVPLGVDAAKIERRVLPDRIRVVTG